MLLSEDMIMEEVDTHLLPVVVIIPLFPKTNPLLPVEGLFQLLSGCIANYSEP